MSDGGNVEFVEIDGLVRSTLFSLALSCAPQTPYYSKPTAQIALNAQPCAQTPRYSNQSIMTYYLLNPECLDDVTMEN